ncbi:MAG: MoaD/ThiS family protein [Planctomycetes bacterium]|nr:MoaD/ThiS family protein [Planctomycetota bacterium]
MVRVTFPSVLQRHVACPPVDVDGGTLRQVLEAAFAHQPTVRGYVLDDAGALRTHLTVFVDGVVVHDRARLAQRVPAEARVDVLQALSGG